MPTIKILKGVEKIVPLTTYKHLDQCSPHAYRNYVSMLLLGTELALHYNPLFGFMFFSPHFCDQQIQNLTNLKDPYQYGLKLFKNFTKKSLSLISKGYNIKSKKMLTDIPYRYSIYKPSQKLQKVINECMKDPVFLLYDTEKLSFENKKVITYEFFGRNYPSIKSILEEKPFYTRRRLEKLVTKKETIIHGLDAAFIGEEKYTRPKQLSKTTSIPVQLIPEQFNVLEEELLHILEKENSLSAYNKLVCLEHIANNMEANGMYTTNYKEIDSGRLYDSYMQRLDSDIRERIMNGNGLNYVSVDIKGGTGSIWYNIAKRIGLSENHMCNLRLFADNPDTYRGQIANDLYMSASAFEKTSLDTISKFVKQAINMVGYGARISPSAILANIEKMNIGKAKPLSIVKACMDLNLPVTYAYNITQSRKFMSLIVDLKYVQSKAIEYFRINKSDTYTNTMGKTITVTSKRGVSAFGKLVAHIYQGAEAEILHAVMSYKVNGTPIASINGAIGLLVHDGYYLSTNVFAEMVHNPLEQHVKNVTGYDIHYTYEAKGLKGNNPLELMEKLTKLHESIDND